MGACTQPSRSWEHPWVLPFHPRVPQGGLRSTHSYLYPTLGLPRGHPEPGRGERGAPMGAPPDTPSPPAPVAGQSRGFAFVEFHHVQDAARWMDANQVPGGAPMGASGRGEGRRPWGHGDWGDSTHGCPTAVIQHPWGHRSWGDSTYGCLTAETQHPWVPWAGGTTAPMGAPGVGGASTHGCRSTKSCLWDRGSCLWWSVGGYWFVLVGPDTWVLFLLVAWPLCKTLAPSCETLVPRCDPRACQRAPSRWAVVRDPRAALCGALVRQARASCETLV